LRSPVCGPRIAVMREADFMNQAIESAIEGIESGDGGPFGACIVSPNGTVVSVAHNEVLATNDPTRHAEIICISEACRRLDTWDLTGYRMYSTTECCPMCFAAAHWARLSRIVYGTKIDDVARLGFNEMKVSNEVMNGYCLRPIKLDNKYRRECLKVLDVWKQVPGRLPY